ncbi:MAG: hypothetical protein J0L92_14880 [Deltaproteobacteria bacterium]|nr:hypothetical protein [Deltaproteobacteria bacterium]
MVRPNVAGVRCPRMSPLVRLRSLVARWRTAQVEQARAAARGEPIEERRLAAIRAPLGSGEARALLDECVTLRILDADDHRVFLGHLADAAREELSHRRAMPAALRASDEVEVEGEPITLGAIAGDATRWLERGRLEAVAAIVAPRARRWSEVHAEADEITTRIEARGPAAPKEEIELEGFLAATDEATHEALARALHALGLAGARGLAAEKTLQVVRALRAAPLDALLSRDGRASRLGRALQPVGTDALVASRLRIEEDTTFASRACLWLVDPPRRVVIAPSPIELGVLSELELLEAFGRGLALTSQSPALPDEHRLSSHTEVPDLLGAIVALFLGAPPFLEKRYGLDVRPAAALAVVSTYAALVRARLDVARAIVRARALVTDSDEANALSRRCLALEAELPIGWLLASPASTETLVRIARSQAVAPAAYLALRERHDEDFFRNPRTGETFAGAGARGSRLSRVEWLAEIGVAGSPAEAARVLLRERLG